MNPIRQALKNGQKLYAYEDDLGQKHFCPDGSCVVCQHCTDLFLDPFKNNEIFGHSCELHIDRDVECDNFVLDEGRRPLTEEEYDAYLQEQAELNEQINKLFHNDEFLEKWNAITEESIQKFLGSMQPFDSAKGDTYQMYVEELSNEN